MNRTFCEICDSKKLKTIFTIPNMPVRIGTSELNQDYKYFNLSYAQCDICNNIQILNLPNPYDVYEENHNKTVVGKTWKNHNQAFANFVSNEVSENCNIFEIGDPSAKIASIIIENENILSWDILEPKAEKINIAKVNLIDGFFDKNFQADKRYDLIVMSHVFEHLTNYSELISKMYQITKELGKVIISVPNMQDILDKKSMPPLHMTFEHTIFINKTNIIELFKKFNFTLKNFETYSDHSDFYVFQKNNVTNYCFDNLMPKDLSDKIIGIVNLKKSRIENFYKEYNKNIYDATFIYGSHVHSQMYLNLGLDENIISGVLDNDIAKHNKFLYGTSLKVYPVSYLNNFQNPLILCDMGAYELEIKKQINQDFSQAHIV
jgi:predicted SAM-dependent methyltransferase